MAGIIGRKVGMTSVFDADGRNIPCTVIEAGPCVVTQVRTPERDGYAALQLGFAEKKEKHTTKALLGHFAKANTTPKRYLAEFQDWEKEYQLGDVINLSDILEGVEWVDIQGVSKGKGFQGVVKRHRFSGVGASVHLVQSEHLLTRVVYSLDFVWLVTWEEQRLRSRIYV